MKNLKKLAFSAIIFAGMFGCKPVFAEEANSDSYSTAENEMVSENSDTETSNSTTDSEQTEQDEMIVSETPALTEDITSIDENDPADVTKTDETDITEAVTMSASADSEGTDTNSSETTAPETVKHLSVLDGVDYSLVYDYDYYSSYTDVKDACGDDEEAVLKNFVQWGIANQRQAISTFDEKSYRYAYQDLRLAFGTNYKAYYLHYIQYGHDEGRKITTGITAVQNPVTSLNGTNYNHVYDYEYYIKEYEDIKNAFGDDDIATLNHFVTYGMSEQRQGISTFDEKSYRYAYQDLRYAFGRDYKAYYLHYIRCGYDEERKDTTDITKLKNAVTVLGKTDYKLVYDYFYYISENADIKNAFGDDDVATLNHFVTYGMSEQRQGISSFDEKSYRYAYQDLRYAFGRDYKAYYLHYIQNGHNENRKDTTDISELKNVVTVLGNMDYKLVYDYYYYIGNYADIKNAFGDDDVATLNHFVTYGMSEQRQGISTFDEVSYRYAYWDLRLVYGTNYKAYYIHYITNGSAEGRTKTTGITEIENATAEDYIAYALQIAADDTHGYWMSYERRRLNPDVDCSSLVWYSLHYTGFNVGSEPFTTSTMGSILVAAGFQELTFTDKSSLQRGDILVVEGKHTEIYIGNNQNVGAHDNYDGVPGDSSGREVCVGNYYNDGWRHVYRLL